MHCGSLWLTVPSSRFCSVQFQLQYINSVVLICQTLALEAVSPEDGEKKFFFLVCYIVFRVFPFSFLSSYFGTLNQIHQLFIFSYFALHVASTDLCHGLSIMKFCPENSTLTHFLFWTQVSSSLISKLWMWPVYQQSLTQTLLRSLTPDKHVCREKESGTAINWELTMLRYGEKSFL